MYVGLPAHVLGDAGAFAIPLGAAQWYGHDAIFGVWTVRLITSTQKYV